MTENCQTGDDGQEMKTRRADRNRRHPMSANFPCQSNDKRLDHNGADPLGGISLFFLESYILSLSPQFISSIPSPWTGGSLLVSAGSANSSCWVACYTR